MGYGCSLKDAEKAIGQSDDGGIDEEDKLGLDIVYIQAKRWVNIVGSKEVRNIVESFACQKTNKEVIIANLSLLGMH
jgi:restriction system protein